MKKFKKNLKGIIAELGFTRGQVKLTVGFCILSGGCGLLGGMLNGWATLIGFTVIVTIYMSLMFDFIGIDKSEFERQDTKKPEPVATESGTKQKHI